MLRSSAVGLLPSRVSLTCNAGAFQPSTFSCQECNSSFEFVVRKPPGDFGGVSLSL